MTLKLTHKSTPTAYFGCNQSATVGNKQGGKQEPAGKSKPLKTVALGNKSNQLSVPGIGEKGQAAGGFEPPNNGFANRRLRPLGHAADI